jgi:immunity protein 35 of polymorphic toxin system
VITYEEAARIAQTFVDQSFPPEPGEPPVVVDAPATVERPYGWIFRYDTATALETGDPDESLLGAAPLLVLREDGRIVRFSSAYSIDTASKAYEADPSQFRHLPPR